MKIIKLIFGLGVVAAFAFGSYMFWEKTQISITIRMHLESVTKIGKLCLLSVQKEYVKKGWITNHNTMVGEEIYILPTDVLLMLEFSEIRFSRYGKRYDVWLPEITAERARVDHQNPKYKLYKSTSSWGSNPTVAIVLPGVVTVGNFLTELNRDNELKPDLIVHKENVLPRCNPRDVLAQGLEDQVKEEICQEALSDGYIDQAKRRAEYIVESLIKLGERNAEGIQFKWYWGEEERLNWTIEAAEQGNAEAQLELGWSYYTGEDGEPNQEKAIRWMRKAAEQGNAEAQYILGWFYHDGSIAEENTEEAFKWMSKAVKQGNADAQCELGSWYFFGNGVEQDEAEAVRLFRLAADQGNADAQNRLGVACKQGRGVAQDDDEAVRWFRMAAKQGHAKGQCNLGRMYLEGRGVEMDAAEASDWIYAAAEQGYARGQCLLGKMCADGIGVEQDDDLAVYWFREAAEQGDSESQFRLGTMYMLGRGVDPDPIEAENWFNLAAEQGHELAQCCVETMDADAKRRPFICDAFRSSGIEWGKRFCLVNSHTPYENHPARDNAIAEIDDLELFFLFAGDVLFWDVPPDGNVSHVLVTSTGLFVRSEGEEVEWWYCPFEAIQTIDWERPPNEGVVINGTKRRIVVENGTEFVAALKKIMEHVRTE